MNSHSFRCSVGLMILFSGLLGCGVGSDPMQTSTITQSVMDPTLRTLHVARPQSIVLPLAADTSRDEEGPVCSSDADCGKELYCKKTMGQCDGQGTCQPFDPDGPCTLDFAPVCGCDGKSYANSCEASRQGVNTVHRGECQGEQACLFYQKDAGSNEKGEPLNVSFAGNFPTQEKADEALTQVKDRSLVQSNLFRGSCKVQAASLACTRLYRPVCTTDFPSPDTQFSSPCSLQGRMLEKAGDLGEQVVFWKEGTCKSE